MGSLKKSLEANLSALPVSLGETRFEAGPTAPGFEDAVRERMEQSDTSISIWLHDENVFLLSTQIDPSPFDITPQGEKPGTAVWEEVISSKVHSEVLSLLPHHYVAKLMGEEPEPLLAKPVEPPVPPKAYVEILNVQIIPRPQESLYSFSGEVGYSPAWPSAGPAVHGARLALDFGIGDHLEFFGGADLRTKLDLDGIEGSRTARQFRLGLKLGAILKKLQLGVSACAVLEISKIDDLEETPFEGESTDVLVETGLGISLFARFWLTKWMGLYAEGGLDLFSGSNRYTVEDETMLEIRPYRPSGAAGLIFRYRGTT